MKRQFVFATVMAAGLTVGLGAQSYPPSSTPQSPSQPKSDRQQETGRGQMVTVVGCLQSGDSTAAATGTTGSNKPSRSASERGTAGTTFKLVDVSQSPTAKPSATGTAGTAGMAGSIPTTVELMASGNSSANWSRYLNHKVEVKGTLENAMGGAESTPRAPEPGANPPSTTPPSTNPPSTNPPSTPPSATNPAGNPSSSAMGSTEMGPTLHVTSIKEVSGTCSSIK